MRRALRKRLPVRFCSDLVEMDEDDLVMLDLELYELERGVFGRGVFLGMLLGGLLGFLLTIALMAAFPVTG